MDDATHTGQVPGVQPGTALPPRAEAALPRERIRNASRIAPDAVAKRWAILRRHTRVSAADQALLLDPQTVESMPAYQRNIENFVGTVRVPVGVVGPLRINGTFASGDYYAPLATTEAALVASYQRGAMLLSEAGGCRAATLSQGVSRAPAFVFRDVAEAVAFARWAGDSFDRFRAVAAGTTSHGRLIANHVMVDGNQVLLRFEFTTGDAAGQNMTTIATAAVCAFIERHCPVPPRRWILECNLAGDKKASALSFAGVRGRKVSADAVLPRRLVRSRLHATPDEMAAVWRLGVLGSAMSGTIGIQGHYANGLAALYIATGQDAACVSESAVGVTRMELTPEGDLYASVTLPSLIVGTVGGGTGLPTQHACLHIADADGTGDVGAFGELCAALCLAGELSLVGALAAGEFAAAHQRLARGRQRGNGAAHPKT